MAAAGGGDLLDLDFGGEGQKTTAAAPAAAAEVPAPAPAAPELTAAPAAQASAPAQATVADDAFGDDDWDAFQSATPAKNEAAQTSAPAGKPAAAVEEKLDILFAKAEETSEATRQLQAANTTAAGGDLLGSVDAPEATKAADAATASAVDAVGSFDPLCAKAEPPQEPDAFAGLDALDKQGGTAADSALISFGANDEFDPVAHTWAKEAPDAQKAAAAAPVAQATPPAATPLDEDFDPDPLAPEKPKPAPAPAVASGGEGDLLGIGGGATGSNNLPVDDDDFILDATHGIDLEPEKKNIFVYYKGEKNVVGWYSDMKAADIKEAVFCACDAIIDGGFVLREVVFTGEDESTAEPAEDGRKYDYEDFGELQHGQTYIIEAAKERDDLKSITGDRWRRLKVQIEPLLHVEANKAIDRMRRGSNLLKHTHYGFPHLRQFQLSDDRKRLIWYSGAKRKEDSVIQLDEILEIRLGQTTPVFLHYRLPMLEHLSFSLVYGPKGSNTLDLTCKDEFEFDHWVTGLKAIFYHFKNKQISKEQLLGHSKRFKKALEKNNVGIKLTKLPEVKEKGHVGLDDCIEIVAHTPQQLDTKMERLRERLKTMSQQVARLDIHAQAEMEVDMSLLMGQGPAYASVFSQDEDAQDEEMEIRRMHELVEQTTQVLQQARNELLGLNNKKNDTSAASGSNDQATAAARSKKKEAAACKHIDQLLWKAEVDLENVEDMYLRHIDNQKETVTPFSVSMADVSRKFSEASVEVEETLRQKMQELGGWFR